MIFPSPVGVGRYKTAKDPTKPRNADDLGKYINKTLLPEAGLEWATIHSLRHTVATQLVEQGVAP